MPTDVRYRLIRLYCGALCSCGIIDPVIQCHLLFSLVVLRRAVQASKPNTTAGVVVKLQYYLLLGGGITPLPKGLPT